MTTHPRGLGITIEKPKNRKPIGHWAIVHAQGLVGSGTIEAPRVHTDEQALGFLSEALQGIIREHSVKCVVVWGTEPNAKMQSTIKPRIRLEGALVAAAELAGARSRLVSWKTIGAVAGAERDKKSYESADVVRGVSVGDANSLAVLAAFAALEEAS